MKDSLKHTFVCCICGKKCTGYGNNPWPLRKRGECCDECNLVVIEARLAQYFESLREKDNE